MSYYVEITFADGEVARHRIRQEGVTLGSSREANIVVPDRTGLDPVHMLLLPRQEGCWLSTARGTDTPAYCRGAVVDGATLPWGSQIDVGALTLRLGSLGDEERRKSSRRRRLMIMTFGSILAAYSLQTEKPPPIVAAATKPPDLGSAIVDDCPTGGDPVVRGAEHLETADAKRARYPFAARDGVAAIQFYAIAARCFEAAAEVDKAKTAAALRDEIRQRVREDFRVHQVRLEHALSVSDYDLVLEESQRLVLFLLDMPGPYRDWLENIQRRIELQQKQDEKGAFW
jgi:hypothetical protein